MPKISTKQKFRKFSPKPRKFRVFLLALCILQDVKKIMLPIGSLLNVVFELFINISRFIMSLPYGAKLLVPKSKGRDYGYSY